MDFRDFSNKTVDDFKHQAKQTQQEFKEANKESYKDYEQIYNKYAGMEQSELMKEFLRVAENKRKEGSLNDGKIQNLYNTLSPMMSEEERLKLQEILNLIKD